VRKMDKEDIVEVIIAVCHDNILLGSDVV
jgi:hypothetical protein